jgi:hypothetical protein
MTTASEQLGNSSRQQMLDGLITLARADFMCFVELAFEVLHPGKKLIYADYLQVMADILMGCRTENSDASLSICHLGT